MAATVWMAHTGALEGGVYRVVIDGLDDGFQVCGALYTSPRWREAYRDRLLLVKYLGNFAPPAPRKRRATAAAT
eukprot:3445608-Prymnesium_polylepis.1